MRPDAWPQRLHALVEAARHKPRALGTHDHLTFALECFEAITRTPAPGAAALSDGAGPLRERASACFGLAAEHWKWARRGDVVLIHPDMLAVCVGAMVARPGPEGLEFVPLGEVRAVWAVG